MPESAPGLRSAEELIARYFESWRRGEAPSLEATVAALPSELAERRAAMWRLVAIDLEFRWRRAVDPFGTAASDVETVVLSEITAGRVAERDTAPTLRDYLARFPELGGAAEVPDALVALEFRLRRRWDSRALRDEYLAEYYERRSWLARLLDEQPLELPTREDSRPSFNDLEPTQPPEDLTSGDLVLPRRFAGYELLERIAQGGMGVVFRARQVDLDRIVAVKMILAGQFASDVDVERFRTEALAAAQLQHPGIVAIYEVGRAEGQHFFSMEYVAGRPLGDLVRERPLPAQRAASLVADIAEAIHYAHQRGVLHRDLKPPNVLLDADDRPRVTDFGLAKRIDSTSNLTATGAMLGTPSYMPPEQVRGEASQIGPASDVYALGAVLYELLTTRPPFQSESALDTFMQVVNQEPVAPRLLNPKTPRDLETICLKCLEKEPSGRYPSAADLSADLRRYLAGEPILARPVGPAGRVLRWCRRRPALASLAASLAAAVVVGFVAVTIQWLRAERNHDLAERNRAQAVRSQVQAERNRDQAEAYFATANDAASKTIAAVDELLRSLPAEEEIDPHLQSTLDRALAVYARLQEQNPANPAVRVERARAQVRVGHILQRLDRFAEATAAHDAAIEELSRLTQDFPQAGAYRVELARSLDLRGQALRRSATTDDRAAAAVSFDRAVALASELLEDPAAEGAAVVLARAYYNRALLRMEEGNEALAENDFALALALEGELADREPNEVDFRRELSHMQFDHGTLLARMRNLDAAFEEFDQALARYEELLAATDADENARREIVFESAVCLANRGNAWQLRALESEDLEERRQRLASARRDYAVAIDRLKPLAARFPGVTRYLEELANGYAGLAAAAELSAVAGDNPAQASPTPARDALLAWRHAHETYERLVDVRPDVVLYRARLATALVNRARIVLDLDQSPDGAGADEAQQLLQTARGHLESILAADQGNLLALDTLGHLYVVQADVCLVEDRLDEAMQAALAASQAAPADAARQLRAIELLSYCLEYHQERPSTADEDLAAAEVYVDAARRIAEQAVRNGLFTTNELARLPELGPLRRHPKFVEWLGPPAAENDPQTPPQSPSLPDANATSGHPAPASAP